MKKISLLLTLLVIFNFTHHANSNEQLVNSNADQTIVDTEISDPTIIDLVNRIAQAIVTVNCKNFVRELL